MALDELRPHLHTHAEHADWIPYRTSYYTRSWGFCLSRRSARRARTTALYEVVIDSTHRPGSLTYGECFLPGERERRGAADDATCAIPRWRTTTCPGSHLLTELAGALAERPAAPLVPLPVHPRHDRLDHVARAQRGSPGQRRRQASSSPASGTPGRSRTSRAAVATRSSTEPRRTSSAERLVAACSISCPGAGTSASSTLPDSISPSAASPDPSRASSPSTTRRPTTSISSGPSPSKNRCRRCSQSSTCSSPTAPTSTSRPGASHSSASGGSTAGWAVADPGTEQLALLWVLNQSDGTHSLLEIAKRSGLAFADLAGAARALVGGRLAGRAGRAPAVSLAGKVCVVTGASSGIGRSLALAFARDGALVWAIGRSRERLANRSRATRRRSGSRVDACSPTSRKTTISRPHARRSSRGRTPPSTCSCTAQGRSHVGPSRRRRLTSSTASSV